MHEWMIPALGIILGAYLIRGISGFGSGLIAVPLLAHFLPLPFVVPFVLVLDFAASLILSGHARRHVRWDEITPLLPFSIAGVVLGVVLLVEMPREPLLLGLGALIILFGARSLLRLQGRQQISRKWATPAGLLGGTVSGLFGTGGPPYVIYLTHRMTDKSELRATFSGLFLIEGAIRLVAFAIAGLLLQPQMWIAIALGLPTAAMGLWLGHRVHVGITSAQLAQLIGALLLLSGGSLIYRAVAG